MTSNQMPHPESDMPSEKPWLSPGSTYFPVVLLQECYKSVTELHAVLVHLDNVGSKLTDYLVAALEQTAYKCVGEVLRNKLLGVFSCAASTFTMAVFQEIEAMLVELFNTEKSQTNQLMFEQTVCHIALMYTKVMKQYYSHCQKKMTELVHALLSLNGQEPAVGEVIKLILKLGLADGLEPLNKSNNSLPSTPWGSPKLRKAFQESEKSPQGRGGFKIMSLFERKSPLDDRRGSQLTELSQLSQPNRDRTPLVSAAAGPHDDISLLTSGHADLTTPNNKVPGRHGDMVSSHESYPLNPGLQTLRSTQDFFVPTIVSSKSQLATEEEIENVINLLSGISCRSVSPMRVIPELVVPSTSMQLTVPGQIYRTLSPMSDSRLEDRRKSQVHRRSEGCLDLSAMGRGVWPQQQHQLHHHRASLPSVQIYSASGHPRSWRDSSSPVPPYHQDSPPPNYNLRDNSSPAYFHSDPPSPFRTQYLKSPGLSAAPNRANLLSPNQWSACPPGQLVGRLGGGADACVNHQANWPFSGGMSPVSPSVADTNSWLAAQDCSDLSDDSSTEDQFFAVGKDLSHAISSRDGSSEEDSENVRPESIKSPHTWLPPDPSHGSLNLAHGLTSELLEPPGMYNPHRPIQMQWSDPLSSRSVWQPTTQDSILHKTSQSMQGFGGAQ